MKRKHFLAVGAGATVVATSKPLSAIAAALPVSGTGVMQLKPAERFMINFMTKYKVPGGQCAVAKDGRLVYARGFGYSDGERQTVVSPTARFRIASSSKPITAVAIMKLVEDGRLGLEEKAFGILSDLKPTGAATVDPRLKEITVRQLLEHSGGFDSSRFDPQFDALRLAAAAVGHAPPATHTDIIRYMMGRPLAFDPGSKYVYSNFGYNVLGRIIEHQTQLSYGEYVAAHILAPAGIGSKSMRLMTRTTPSARLADEVYYFDGPLALPTWPIYPDVLESNTYSYGGFDGAAIDAHGGWIANAIDLTRFLNAVGGSTGTQLLKAQTVRTMLTRPNIPQYHNAKKYYALGWDINPGTVMQHNGALTFGTLSSVTRLPNEITFAMLFNHLDANFIPMVIDLERSSVRAISDIRSWPSGNLYEVGPDRMLL